MTMEERHKKFEEYLHATPAERRKFDMSFLNLDENDDESIRKELLLDIPKVFPYDKAFRYITWLEKQKEQKPVQTEKEKQYIATLHDIIDSWRERKRGYDKAYYDHIEEWLDGRHIEQKPAEWSEEDKEIMDSLIKYHYDQGEISPKHNKWASFLKTLRPQPHWKPSEEQMKIFNEAIEHYSKYWDSEDIKILCSLYDNLKKLM